MRWILSNFSVLSRHNDTLSAYLLLRLDVLKICITHNSPLIHQLNSAPDCLRKNVDLWGNDLGLVIVTNLNECVEKCYERPECQSFTYVTTKKQCFLKSVALTDQTIVYSDGLYSGNTVDTATCKGKLLSKSRYLNSRHSWALESRETQTKLYLNSSSYTTTLCTITPP